jgi:IS30 family transposase
MATYCRVTEMDRVNIKAYQDGGFSITGISEQVGLHKSTVSRELRRNAGERGYRPKQAQAKADARQEFRQAPRKLTDSMKIIVTKLLHEAWSPEQISHRLKLDGHESVSHETIYKFVYEDKIAGGNLHTFLRQGHRKRKKRFPSQKRKSRLKDINPIAKRPEAANTRSEKGHWERDLVIGKGHQGALLTIVDRKTRYTKIELLTGKGAIEVGVKTSQALKDLPKKSMTNDRGLEFADHKTTAEELNCKVYFCDPYSSQQRGTNENTNGLIRQFFPKKMSLKNVTVEEVRNVENNLNSRPRKILDWLSPYEVTDVRRTIRN